MLYFYDLGTDCGNYDLFLAGIRSGIGAEKKLLVKQVVVTQLRQIKAVFSYGLLNLIAVWLMLNQPEMLRCSCIAEKPLLAARQAGSAVGTD